MSVSMVSLTECVTFRSDVFLNSKPLQRAACLRLASGIPAPNPGPPFRQRLPVQDPTATRGHVPLLSCSGRASALSHCFFSPLQACDCALRESLRRGCLTWEGVLSGRKFIPASRYYPEGDIEELKSVFLCSRIVLSLCVHFLLADIFPLIFLFPE